MIRLLTRNIGLKGMALAVAVLLWLATVGEGDITSAVAVPVQYRNIPASLEISSELVESAYVEVRGAAGRMSGSSLANAVIIIDLSGETRAGERTHSILRDNVRLPPGIQFLRAVPSQIRLRLEPQVARELPVVARYASRLPGELQIVKQEVSPIAVKLLGPESRVTPMDRVQTDPIELAPVEGEQMFHVHPFTGDPLVRLDRADLLVTVKVTLGKSR